MFHTRGSLPNQNRSHSIFFGLFGQKTAVSLFVSVDRIRIRNVNVTLIFI